MKTPEQCMNLFKLTRKIRCQNDWRRSDVFIAHFKQNWCIVLKFSLLTLSKKMPGRAILLPTYFRSSYPKVFHRISVLKNYLKGTQRHLWWSLFLFVKACVRYFSSILYFQPNDSPSKTTKNVFYFI